MIKQCRVCQSDFEPSPSRIKRGDWICKACAAKYQADYIVKRNAEGRPLEASRKVKELTAERARELLDYDKGSGLLRWKARRGSSKDRSGKVAGCVSKGNHYHLVRVENRMYGAHRLAWLIVTGSWPTFEIDHINRDKTDNRWCNLRDVTHQENMLNQPQFDQAQPQGSEK